MGKISLLHIIYRAYKTTESYPNHMIEGTYNDPKLKTYVYSMAKAHKNDSAFKYKLMKLPISAALTFFSFRILLDISFVFTYVLTKKSDNKLWIKTNLINLFRFICLSNFIRKEKISHIHFHFGHHALFFIELKRFQNINTFISYYGVDTSIDNLARYKKIKRYSDCNLVLSNFMKRDLINGGFKKENISILKIALKFSTMPLNCNHQRKKQILFAGRLVPKKRIIDAIDAFNLFQKKYPDYTMLVIGEGPEFDIAKEHISKLNLNDKINLAGYQPPEETFKAMSESKVFLLPSKTAPCGDKEGTPVVIIESQLLGLPVVSTYHAGIPEIVDDRKTALLTPEGDIQKLASSIESIISTKEKWINYSSNGISFIKNEYNVLTRTNELLNIYKSI